MSEFDRRKQEVGPPDGKSERQRRVDAAYVLGANPDHQGGRPKLLQLADDPDPVVSAAAREQLYGPPVADDSECDDPDNDD